MKILLIKSAYWVGFWTAYFRTRRRLRGHRYY